jgi:hypothetical protein
MNRCAHLESRKSTNRCAAAGFVLVARIPTPAALTSAPGSPLPRKWFSTGIVGVCARRLWR